jgi:hypothetical protein
LTERPRAADMHAVLALCKVGVVSHIRVRVVGCGEQWAG